MTNKEAYDLLKSLGCINIANEAYDPKYDYLDEAIEAYRDRKR